MSMNCTNSYKKGRSRKNTYKELTKNPIPVEIATNDIRGNEIAATLIKLDAWGDRTIVTTINSGNMPTINWNVLAIIIEIGKTLTGNLTLFNNEPLLTMLLKDWEVELLKK